MIFLSNEEMAILGVAEGFGLKPVPKSSLVFSAASLLGFTSEEVRQTALDGRLRKTIDTLTLEKYLRQEDFLYEITAKGHEAFVLERQEFRKFHDRLQVIL